MSMRQSLNMAMLSLLVMCLCLLVFIERDWLYIDVGKGNDFANTAYSYIIAATTSTWYPITSCKITLVGSHGFLEAGIAL